jgi:CRISPR-associated protein Cmr3
MSMIEIKAVDTLFFRDGKPFEMGEDSWAEGIFPPPMSVFYGAIRSAYFAEYPEKINTLNGENDPTKNLKITKIFLKKGNQFYLPAPFDFVKKKDEGNDTLYPLYLINNEEIYSNYSLSHLPYFNDNVENVNGHFISYTTFLRYYKTSGIKAIKGEDLNAFFKTEAKIGVGLNNYSRSSEEGKLFRVGLNRLNQDFDQKKNEFINEVSFVIEYNLTYIPKLLKLGAENKAAQINSIDSPSILDFNQEQLLSKYFKILLLTPTAFNDDWKPNIPDLTTEVDVELISAFIGKPISLGGWDIKNRCPKEMHKAVPAGSVYYYKIKNDKTLSDVIKAFSKIDLLTTLGDNMGLYEIAFLDYDKQKIDL